MKKRISILIVVLLVLILIFSSFANAYANPLAPLIGSQFGRAAMTTVISGMLIKDFTDATIVTWDSVMELVDTTKWYFGQHSGGYGLSIPKEDLELMYSELESQLGGYGSTSYGYDLANNDFVQGINYREVHEASMTAFTNHMKAYNVIIYVGVINSRHSYLMLSSDSSLNYWSNWAGSYILSDSTMYYTYSHDNGVIYNQFSTSPQSFKFSLDGIYQSFTKELKPLPSNTWDSRYVNDLGINYNGWMEQPGGRYIVNVPTTTDELGNLIVDDVALANQTPDLARVSDRLTELQEVPVNDVETWNPVPPTTNPVTDPITDVASESWLDRLWSKFVNLFILPDDYFIKNFQYLKNEVPMMAFPLQIISDIERMASLSGGYLDDIYADGWGGHHKIVDFQFLRDMLPTFHNFLRGIMFILLLMYNYDQVYKLIRGNSYGFGSSRQETIPQQIESPFKSLGRS